MELAFLLLATSHLWYGALPPESPASELRIERHLPCGFRSDVFLEGGKERFWDSIKFLVELKIPTKLCMCEITSLDFRDQGAHKNGLGYGLAGAPSPDQSPEPLFWAQELVALKLQIIIHSF